MDRVVRQQTYLTNDDGVKNAKKREGRLRRRTVEAINMTNQGFTTIRLLCFMSAPRLMLVFIQLFNSEENMPPVTLRVNLCVDLQGVEEIIIYSSPCSEGEFSFVYLYT